MPEVDVTLRVRIRGSGRQGHRGGGAGRRSAALPCHCALIARAPTSRGCGGDGGGCRVGPGAVPAFRRARFPGPPSEPGVPVIPAPGSPRGPLPTTVVLPLGSAVPGLDCQPDAGIHRRLLPCRPATAASLCPFAMCTPLACSDDDGHSATTCHPQPTTRLPAAPRREGRLRVASHVHHHPVDEVGAQRYPGSLARGTPQPFPLASPTGHYKPAAESPAATAAGVHC
jgi:hypothetical protein